LRTCIIYFFKYLIDTENMMLTGGKATVKLQAGERLRIITPGGGGFGEDYGGTDKVREGPLGRGHKRYASGGSVSDLGLEKGSVLDYRRRQETA
jgi:hypothetical protein